MRCAHPHWRSVLKHLVRGELKCTYVYKNNSKTNNPWSVGESRGGERKESMSIYRRLLVHLGNIGTLLGAGVSFVPGLPRKTTSDLDEGVRADFEAWARSGSEVASSTLRCADRD